jgi:hypothetical protein
MELRNNGRLNRNESRPSHSSNCQLSPTVWIGVCVPLSRWADPTESWDFRWIGFRSCKRRQAGSNGEPKQGSERSSRYARRSTGRRAHLSKESFSHLRTSLPKTNRSKQIPHSRASAASQNLASVHQSSLTKPSGGAVRKVNTHIPSISQQGALTLTGGSSGLHVMLRQVPRPLAVRQRQEGTRRRLTLL